MTRSCGHELTETLESDESVAGSGVVLVNRLEACVICGQRRTVTEKSGEVSAGPWEPLQAQLHARPPSGPGAGAGERPLRGVRFRDRRRADWRFRCRRAGVDWAA